ncbi:MAG TPA: hypothetical protein VMC44_00735, partial [Geobacteraceae bacterium]|nr:hypothetical protein [Geobacteraceae bacterium]
LMKGVLKNLRESGVVPGVEPEQPAATASVEPAAGIEPTPVAAVEEMEQIIPPAAVAEAAAPVIEPVKETGLPEVFEPVIEIGGQAESLSGGRLRLPLKVRCGESEKEVVLTITVAVGLE